MSLCQKEKNATKEWNVSQWERKGFHSPIKFRNVTQWESWIGHRVLYRSERSVLSHSFKECSVLFRSLFEFLATYETEKNVPFFSKERKRT